MVPSTEYNDPQDDWEDEEEEDYGSDGFEEPEADSSSAEQEDTYKFEEEL